MIYRTIKPITVSKVGQDKPMSIMFDKIQITGYEELKEINIEIELPNENWIEDYHHNIFQSFKQVGNKSFLYDNSDLIQSNANISIENSVIRIPIKPHKNFHFRFMLFENTHTEVTLRPLKQLYIGHILNFEPKVRLNIGYENNYEDL